MFVRVLPVASRALAPLPRHSRTMCPYRPFLGVAKRTVFGHKRGVGPPRGGHPARSFPAPGLQPPTPDCKFATCARGLLSSGFARNRGLWPGCRPVALPRRGGRHPRNHPAGTKWAFLRRRGTAGHRCGQLMLLSCNISRRRFPFSRPPRDAVHTRGAASARVARFMHDFSGASGVRLPVPRPGRLRLPSPSRAGVFPGGTARRLPATIILEVPQA